MNEAKRTSAAETYPSVREVRLISSVLKRILAAAIPIARDGAIPVVAVTAFAMKGDEERIREGGCEAYLSKPISVGKFIETIRHFLGAA